MALPVDLAPEVIVGGRYRLVEGLATGGTADVWRAVDTASDREVAVKVLRDEGVDPALRERARREVKLLEGIEHPNVVRVLDSGDGGGLPFMVMELLTGDPLSRVIDARGRIPVDEAVALVADVADGLGEAHARGVVHRDVKPANIVCHDLVPTIVDFGIAREVDATTLTRGLVVGTAAYLAPEQAQGLAVSPACDVYALGCVLYELLTGRPPFDGGSPVTVALKHVQESPVPPGDVAEVPPAVDALVMRCLAKDPAQRPADGTALAAALRAAVASDGGDDTVAIAPLAPSHTMVMPVVETDADLIDPSPLPPVAPPPRRSARLSHGALLALALAALLLFGAARMVSDADGIDVQTVPDTTGAPVADATTYLEGAGFDVDVARVEADVPAGTVVASDPAPGQVAGRGDTVRLSVSAGPAPAPTTTSVTPADRDDEGGGNGNGNGRGRGRDKD